MENLSPDLLRFLRYCQFKQECIQYQFENPIRLNYDLAVRCKDELLKQQEEKVEQLKGVMPKVPVIKKKTKPKITHKKDGTLSTHGEKWFRLLKEHKEPPNFDGVIEVVDGYDEPNPNSTDQVKAWLYSLGWKPCTYKFVRDKSTGDERQIEQVRKDGELTSSVLRLKDKTPQVEILEGLTIIQHRLGIFQGFIDCAILKPCPACDGTGDWYSDNDQTIEPCPRCKGKKGKYYLRAEIGGLTNTLRFKHKKPLVNLPGVDKPWGKEIRGCLVADDGEVFIGADMTSLEDTCKRHYMKPLDPGYVEEMSQPGYDPHLKLLVIAGEITEDDYEFYTRSKKITVERLHESPRQRFDRIDKLRKKAKVANYSALYSVGAAKLSRESGMSRKEAQFLLDEFWKLNWSIKEVSRQQFTKEVGGYIWLKNPVSGFWYELRHTRDIFSTLNQGTGVFLFDSWLARARLKGYNGQGQSHDETFASVADESRSREALKYGIEKLNQDLKLNVSFGIDTKTGRDYSETH